MKALQKVYKLNSQSGLGIASDIRDQRYPAITSQDLSLPAPPLETTISTEISDEEEVGVV